MNPDDLPEHLTIHLPEGDIQLTIHGCDCPECSLDITTKQVEDTWRATSDVAPGMVGTGWCEEEAVNAFLDLYYNMPWN